MFYKKIITFAIGTALFLMFGVVYAATDIVLEPKGDIKVVVSTEVIDKISKLEIEQQSLALLDLVKRVGECIPRGPEPICGNNIIEKGEVCDDGNDLDGDGCSAICSIEDEDSLAPLVDIPVEMADTPEEVDTDMRVTKQYEIQGEISEAKFGMCGNGVIEGEEACDDGNTLDGDSCSASCMQEYKVKEPEPEWQICANMSNVKHKAIIEIKKAKAKEEADIKERNKKEEAQQKDEEIEISEEDFVEKDNNKPDSLDMGNTAEESDIQVSSLEEVSEEQE